MVQTFFFFFIVCNPKRTVLQVRTLIRRGADIDAVNYDGRTALAMVLIISCLYSSQEARRTVLVPLRLCNGNQLSCLVQAGLPRGKFQGGWGVVGRRCRKKYFESLVSNSPARGHSEQVSSSPLLADLGAYSLFLIFQWPRQSPVVVLMTQWKAVVCADADTSGELCSAASRCSSLHVFFDQQVAGAAFASAWSSCWLCRGDVEQLQRLLNGKADPDQGDYDMRTALHVVFNDYYSCTIYYFTIHADCKDYWPSLCWQASAEGHIKIVELLLSASANVNCKDRSWNRFLQSWMTQWLSLI